MTESSQNKLISPCLSVLPGKMMLIPGRRQIGAVFFFRLAWPELEEVEDVDDVEDVGVANAEDVDHVVDVEDVE